MTTRPRTHDRTRLQNEKRVLDDEKRELAERIAFKYPTRRSAMLPLLFLVQSVEGYVSEDGMREVGEILGLTPAEVLAASSFYTMLRRKPTGEYVVSVCRNITCSHLGGRRVISSLCDHLGIEVGGTTADGKVTVETAECLATCDGAPSAQVNYEDVYNLTPQVAVDLVERLRRGEELVSVRGEPIKTHREACYEIALSGLIQPRVRVQAAPDA